MATIKKHFYVAKGENDTNPKLYYGEEPPKIIDAGFVASLSNKCIYVGPFLDNPIADSIQDNEIVKIYIRKETKKIK